jgi:hypothetical protein
VRARASHGAWGAMGAPAVVSAVSWAHGGLCACCARYSHDKWACVGTIAGGMIVYDAESNFKKITTLQAHEVRNGPSHACARRASMHGLRD